MMKALKLLIIVVLCALRISLLHAQRECYHYKDKTAFIKDSTVSTIEFRNDTVFIMDFPSFLLLEYSIGKYKVNPDSTVIECEMYKDITFSTNTGSVSWYTKDCHRIVKLGISKENELIPERQWFAKCLLVLTPPTCVVKPRQCAALSAFYALAGVPMTAQSFSQTTIFRVYQSTIS